MVERLDRQMKSLDETLRRELGMSISQIPGTGAAGGMGSGCIAFLNARLKPGIQAVLDMVGCDQQLESTDLVITGEGRIDSQSVHGKVISGVAWRVSPKGIPLMAVVGGIAEGASTLAYRGFFPVEDLPTLRHIDSYLQGHPNMNSVPGVDMSTGSLGQGISAAFTLARRTKGVPTAIVMKIIKGVSYMENQAGWHGKAPTTRSTRPPWTS